MSAIIAENGQAIVRAGHSVFLVLRIQPRRFEVGREDFSSDYDAVRFLERQADRLPFPPWIRFGDHLLNVRQGPVFTQIGPKIRAVINTFDFIEEECASRGPLSSVSGSLSPCRSGATGRDPHLDALSVVHRVSWTWTRGHAGDAMNNRADFLAGMASRKTP